jgi:hypothetical protein
VSAPRAADRTGCAARRAGAAQNGSYVFRISADNKAEQVEVEIGDSAGNLVAVSGDPAEGDRVAIRGAENLSESANVKILVSDTASTNDTDAVP